MVVLDEYKMLESISHWEEAEKETDCWVLFGDDFQDIEAAVECKDKGQFGIYRYVDWQGYHVDIPREHYKDWPYATVSCKCIYPLTKEEVKEIKEWK